MPTDNPGPTDAAADVPVCGMGASAGGIEALNEFFHALPADVGLAYVVVVHLAPDRKSELPAILARHTKMPVVQVGDHHEEPLLADHVYVIAPDRKLVVADASVGAEPFDQPRGHRMAIDLLFRSLAETRGDGFAVVFSGTGSDGATGAKAVKSHGGLILVQDPTDAAYPEMPRAVIAAGVADVVLPVHELARRLVKLARNRPALLPLINAQKELEPIADAEEKALRKIFEVLRKRSGHDLSKYKRSTVLRRLSRRMQLSDQLSIADYLGYLRAHSTEVQALFADFLVSVTSFFRDSESWAALQAEVIGPLLEHLDPDEQIRVWVPGCASGEEAYTVAMLFQEESERRKATLSHLLVFATDVDEKALAVAREGLYPQSITADISKERLKRFFRREDEHFRVVSDIRDRIVFAAHDVLRDPPFSRLHLICCRNLLIYLDRDLQQQVMGVFRYALSDGGHLFIGASETVDEELFQPTDGRHRIFLARPRAGARAVPPELLSSPGPRALRYCSEAPPPSRLTAVDLHLAAQEQIGPSARRATNLIEPEKSLLVTRVHPAPKDDDCLLLEEELRDSNIQRESLSEELAVLNAELQQRVRVLNAIHDDLSNLINAADIIVVFLDPQLRIRRFTSGAARLLALNMDDIGKPLGQIDSKLIDSALEQEVRQVIYTATRSEKDLHARKRRWYLRRILPYRAGGQVIGAVIAWTDITQIKSLQQEVSRIAALEQQRIGQELHDGIQQELTGLGLLAQTLADKLSTKEATADRDLAERLAQGLATANYHVRTLARGLVPVPIDADKLAPALAELARSTQEAFHLACSFESEPVKTSDARTASHLYRIAQEAVRNAIRHSNAHHISLRLAQSHGELRLEVKDDGIGLPPRTELRRGVGLRLMEHRCSLLGGRFIVQSHPGRGTLIACKLPAKDEVLSV